MVLRIKARLKFKSNACRRVDSLWTESFLTGKFLVKVSYTDLG